uniref:BTB domain-containing protein n=1 Tax=Onchocerca volvulus TaxID=6282 RepID=A0A8R1Y2I6_ONCVO
MTKAAKSFNKIEGFVVFDGQKLNITYSWLHQILFAIPSNGEIFLLYRLTTLLLPHTARKRNHGCMFITMKAVTEIGSSLQSVVPMIVYYRHVWWNYGYKLTLEENKCFSLLLKSLGPTANPEKKVPRGAICNNSPNNQKSPRASNVRVTLNVKKSEILETVTERELVESSLGIGYICVNLINQSSLQELTKNHEFIILHISMNINKDYFNIEELIEFSVAPSIEISMNPGNYNLLEAVLTQQPSRDSDFVFTRGSGANNDATSYHVHQNVLKQRSFMLEGILRQKHSLPTDQLLVVDTEDRIIFPYLTDDDMKFLLTYLYTGKIILPKFDGFARVGRILSLLIDREQLVNIFMHWQKLIVKNLLQVEKNNNNDRIIEESFKALISVFSAPYGALPYAKRMALSLLADQITKSNEALVEKYNEQSQYGPYQVGHFIEIALKLKRIITSIKKIPCIL